jgi:hypothetical protein
MSVSDPEPQHVSLTIALADFASLRPIDVGNGRANMSAQDVASVIKRVQAVRRQSGRRIWLELSSAIGREIDRLRSETNGAEEVKQEGAAEDSATSDDGQLGAR